MTMPAFLRRVVAAATAAGPLLLAAAVPLRAALGAQDWPMWGGTPGRNMASAAANMPAVWDPKTGAGIKWKAELGSTSYGNPVVAGGKVFAGTNNANPRNPDVTGDKGILMCFRESDGAFLWQAVTDKLEEGKSVDWPDQGVASSPAVSGSRLYYVTNRAELVALDTEGFADGENDGPVTDERLKGPADADIVWRLDMKKELGVRPRNLANSSPAVWENLVFVVTSNGRDDEAGNVLAPDAPSFLAVNRETGKVVWQDKSPGDRILHGQWASPSLGEANGVMQAGFPGGDGWLYAFNARTGAPLWRFDLNPKDAVWPKTRNDGLATPVFHGGRVYMAVGQDPESGEGAGHLYCIDPAKTGDITATGLVWHYDKIRRSISTVAIADGVLYAADFSGFLHGLDAATGAPHWTFDMLAAVWGSPLVADGKVYLGDEDGDVVVLQAGKALKKIAEINMGSAVYSTPVPANGVLFVMNTSQLFAIAAPPAGARQ
jgi:outer membrane protein assembly factor BamB